MNDKVFRTSAPDFPKHFHFRNFPATYAFDTIKKITTLIRLIQTPVLVSLVFYANALFASVPPKVFILSSPHREIYL